MIEIEYFLVADPHDDLPPIRQRIPANLHFAFTMIAEELQPADNVGEKDES